MNTVESAPAPAWWRHTTALVVAAAAVLVIGLSQSGRVIAQYYPGGYTPPAAPAYRGPNLAGGASTYSVNPWAASKVNKAPSYPIGTSRGYYGGVPTPGLPTQPKPFTGMYAPRPLVSSMDAARINVMSGLWMGL